MSAVEDNAKHFGYRNCPHCGYRTDMASPVNDKCKNLPQVGDISLCINCGELGLFDADYQLIQIPDILIPSIPKAVLQKCAEAKEFIRVHFKN